MKKLEKERGDAERYVGGSFSWKEFLEAAANEGLRSRAAGVENRLNRRKKK